MSAVKLVCEKTIPNVFSPIGNLWQFQCECVSEQWVCSGNYVGGGVGNGCPPDAADAGTADGGDNPRE
jgi:hypothetical protein